MERYTDMIPGAVLTLAAGLCLIRQKIRGKRLFRENQALQLRQNLMMEYYAAWKEQMDLTRKMRHDIANHMQTLEELAKRCQDDGAAMDYADSLKASYKRLERINYCQDIVVNSVIHNKIRVCHGENIRTDIHMDFFEKGSIPEMEVVGLLHNLLDNAIEACRMVDGEGRFIEMEGRTVAGHAVITMRNSMKEVSVKNGRFLTHKKDKEMHGIGMAIIGDFVKNHDGTMQVEAENGVFEINICVES